MKTATASGIAPRGVLKCGFVQMSNLGSPF